MLEKTKREYAKLQQGWDIDNIFNFFVTAYHVQDWIEGYIKETKVIDATVLKNFLDGQDIKDCRDMCDKGKHRKLTRRKYSDPITTIWDGSINGAPINAIAINGDDKWILINGDREIDVKWLAERVLAKWEKFFSANGL